GYDYNNVTSNPIIRPPLENGWNWKSTQPNVRHEIAPEVFEQNDDDEDDDEVDDDCDDLEDTDDDLMS
ncbi:protein SUPPRESSOR OF GENE SILENCING 3-like, partial [Trifolium medium]|nr:protein SUPPRESSOR OF GENE SILENCING 3-like [Trifolium medium]